MLVAPTELRHAAFRALTRDGKGSNRPESWGCDFAFTVSKEGVVLKYGIQRKELKDFVASVNDKRLAKEVQQMCVLAQGLLIIEGSPRWSMDGELIGDNYGRGWTRKQHIKQLISVQDAGVWVLSTNDTVETAKACVDFEEWVRAEKHTSLMGREGIVHPWGRAENDDYKMHVIMGLPGVGIELAQRIYKTIGMPIGLRVTREQLMSVEGIAAGKADNILRALDAI